MESNVCLKRSRETTKTLMRIGINRREEKGKRTKEEMKEEKNKYSIAINKQARKGNKQREVSYICSSIHLLSKVEMTSTNCTECMKFCYSICMWFAKRELRCVVPGFRRGVNKICTLLRFYAAYIGSLLATFRDNLSRYCPETSVTNYQSSLRKVANFIN